MDKKNDGQIIIKVCCLLASFILWLYIFSVVNPIKNETIRYVPVEVKNADSLSQFKLTVLPDQKFYVTLTLSGNATDINSTSRDQFKLVADMSGYGFKKGDNPIPVKIVNKPNNITILNSETLWVNIKTDEFVQKDVPVKLQKTGKVKDGYYDFDAVINPAKVQISGPSEYVNQITAAQCKVNLTNSTSDLDEVVNLVPINDSDKTINNVTVKPVSTEVKIPIKIVKTVPVNLKTTGTVDKSYSLKSITTMPDKVEIAVNDTASSNNITSIDTEAVNISKLTPNQSVQAKLIIPDGVKLIDSTGVVDVKYVLNKIVQKTFSVNVAVKNKSDAVTETLNVTSVSVVVTGDENIINSLKDTDLSASVDLSNLTDGSYTLPVTLTLPDGVQKISMSPETIIVTVKKTQ